MVLCWMNHKKNEQKYCMYYITFDLIQGSSLDFESYKLVYGQLRAYVLHLTAMLRTYFFLDVLK